jgi:hypothetical protein
MMANRCSFMLVLPLVITTPLVLELRPPQWNKIIPQYTHLQIESAILLGWIKGVVPELVIQNCFLNSCDGCMKLISYIQQDPYSTVANMASSTCHQAGPGQRVEQPVTAVHRLHTLENANGFKL